MNDKISKVLIFILSTILLIQCSDNSKSQEDDFTVKKNGLIVDSLATKETVALFENLKSFTVDKVLFGHQETTAYGVGWVNDGFGNKSDVKEVCGDFPAVYGWDIGNIENQLNNDGVPFSQMKLLIQQAYKRGAINTISNHMINPVTAGGASDNTPAVSHVLPGGSHHGEYIKSLDLIAEFMNDLKAKDGTYIPLIFRPFHEHNGDWFWWGRGPTSEAEFIALWHYTVDYLKNEKNIHHLLYAFSPDRSRMGKPVVSSSDYFYGYPGDDYVDILGLDNYYDLGSHWNQAPLNEQAESFVKSLEMIVKLAEERNKIPVLTETGLDKLHIAGWWTEMLFAGINANEITRKIAYVLVWRNANTEHFHAPFPGHFSEADFIKFYNDPLTVFEADLPDMYK